MARGGTFSGRSKRRRFVRLAGGASVAGLAGCLSQEDRQGSGNANYDENSDVASDMAIVAAEDCEFANEKTNPAEDRV